MKSDLELEFLAQVRLAGLPEPEREYRFHPTRRWKFDFCWPSKMVAVELEGGTWTGGRHTRPVGFEQDCEKYNEAAIMGWRVLRFTANMVRSGEALTETEQEVK